MKFEFVAKTLSVLGGAAVAGLLAATPAMADPVPSPAPTPIYAEAAAPLPGSAPNSASAAPGAASAALGVASPAPAAVGAAADPAAADAAGTTAVPVTAPGQVLNEGVPHLASPENLPPGTSTTAPPSTSRLGYLRDLWHAMQTQEVSGSDALLLLTQRPMTSSPKPGMAAGPQPAPAAAPAPVPAPAAPPAPVVP